MNILGISGSPHSDGNTAFALQHGLHLLEEQRFTTRYISLAEKTINPCMGCFTCWNTRKCCHEDDMPEILEALDWCDGLLIGSPVYFGLITSQLKALMDRTVFHGKDRPRLLSEKIGGGITCGGFRNGGQELTLQCIHTFMLQWNMLVVSDGAPYCHSGGAIAGAAKSDETGLTTVSNLARNMAKLMADRR